MRFPRLVKVVAPFSMVVVAAGTLAAVIATPASAGCARTLYYKGDQGQVDNCPGNGSPSWAWVWNGSNDGLGVYIDAQDYHEGHTKFFTNGRGGRETEDDFSANLSQRTWRLRLCKFATPRTWEDCSGWTYM